MTLIVEDGTVIANAESYISVAEADTYWTNHGDPASWTDATTIQKEVALRYATSWIDVNYKWRSTLLEEAQVLDWPRGLFVDDDCRTRGGTTIPQELKDAEAEMALFQIDGNLHLSSTNTNLISREIGKSKDVYASGGASNRSVTHPYVSGLLSILGTPVQMARRIRRA